MPSTVKCSARKKAAYLRHLEDGLRRGKAAKAIGMSRQHMRRLMVADEAFLAAVEEAELSANEPVEDAIYEKAKQGEFAHAAFWLTNRDPQHWQDRRRVDIGAAKADPDKLLARMTGGELPKLPEPDDSGSHQDD